MTSIVCVGCSKAFPSKNQLFRHLHLNAETCLSPNEFKDFLANTQSKKREKVAVLYGYIPGTDYRFRDQHISKNDTSFRGIEGGDHAAWLVTQAVDLLSSGMIEGASNASGNLPPWTATAADDSKINRSYGSVSRVSKAVTQDLHTGAVTEVLCTDAVPFYADDESLSDDGGKVNEVIIACNQEKQITIKTRAWVKSVNEQLDRMLAEMASACHHSMTNNHLREWSPGMIRVFGRVSIPQKKFNAETDVTHRRIDYCLPADFLYGEGSSITSVQFSAVSFQEFCDYLPSFHPDNALHSAISLHASTKAYLLRMKKVMKRITLQPENNEITAQLGNEVEWDVSKRRRKKKKGRQKNEELHGNKAQSSMQFLKRKRFHNFCPKILAHDFLAFRRVDRMYHRATIRVDSIDSPSTDTEPVSSISSTRIHGRPFIIFSLTGDIFLQEQ